MSVSNQETARLDKFLTFKLDFDGSRSGQFVLFFSLSSAFYENKQGY